MSKLHPNSSTAWTTEDVVTVISMKHAGGDFNTIAKQLGRTPAACSTKYYETKREHPHLFASATPSAKPTEQLAPETAFAQHDTAWAVLAGGTLFALGIILGLQLN